MMMTISSGVIQGEEDVLARDDSDHLIETTGGQVRDELDMDVVLTKLSITILHLRHHDATKNSGTEDTECSASSSAQILECLMIAELITLTH